MSRRMSFPLFEKRGRGAPGLYILYLFGGKGWIKQAEKLNYVSAPERWFLFIGQTLYLPREKLRRQMYNLTTAYLSQWNTEHELEFFPTLHADKNVFEALPGFDWMHSFLIYNIFSLSFLFFTGVMVGHPGRNDCFRVTPDIYRFMTLYIFIADLAHSNCIILWPIAWLILWNNIQ